MQLSIILMCKRLVIGWFGTILQRHKNAKVQRHGIVFSNEVPLFNGPVLFNDLELSNGMVISNGMVLYYCGALSNDMALLMVQCFPMAWRFPMV